MKQRAFLLLNQREVFYGGAAGGGKSDALLMAALQYADVPGYAALLLRRKFTELSKPGALLHRAKDWMATTDAKWQAIPKTYVFPGGGSLTFGNLEKEADKYQYQSDEYQFIGFDELTQFTNTQYRYLFSRLRRLKGSKVPIRMRSASNPGNIGHQWVKQRFITDGKKKGRIFLPASLVDNPYLDQDEYTASLNELDPITRKQLLDGDWTARRVGGKFDVSKFNVVDRAPKSYRVIRYWDMAATEATDENDPDWTVGAKVCIEEGNLYILDIVKIRGNPGKVQDLVSRTAKLDGRRVEIQIEQEPGASGVTVIDHYVRTVLPGYAVYGDRPTGDKEHRANPLASMVYNRNVNLLNGSWIADFLDEAELNPNGDHDDQIDAVSGGYSKLTDETVPQVRVL